MTRAELNKSNFNSIKVRLKHEVLETTETNRNFNSIKVRLKRSIRAAIKEERRFQFHKGTIKTSHHTTKFLSKVNFNSIKVRLKPCKDGKHADAIFISIP